MTDINSIIEMIEKVRPAIIGNDYLDGYDDACDDIIEQLRKMSDWQSMDTAPKDGTMIWISDGKKMTVALWYKGNTENYWKDWFLSSGVDKKNLIGWQHLPKPPNSKEL